MCDLIDKKLGSKIGFGTQGTIYQNIENPNTVFKKIIRSNIHKDDTEQMFEISRKAGVLGVGPKVFTTLICPNPRYPEAKFNGYLEMEKIIGKTLDTENDMKYKAQLLDKLTLLRDNGIKYDDNFNAGNYMIGTTASHPEAQIWIIDYGDKLTPVNDIPIITDKYVTDILDYGIKQGIQKKEIEQIIKKAREDAEQRAKDAVKKIREKSKQLGGRKKKTIKKRNMKTKRSMKTKRN